jgi:hypothetical protein
MRFLLEQRMVSAPKRALGLVSEIASQTLSSNGSSTTADAAGVAPRGPPDQAALVRVDSPPDWRHI